jgi:hypothetical protein
MDFNKGDIVLIDHYPLPEAIGRQAQVLIVRPRFLGAETWYVLAEVNGKKRAAAHSWLRRMEWGELQTLLGLTEIAVTQ